MPKLIRQIVLVFRFLYFKFFEGISQFVTPSEAWHDNSDIVWRKKISLNKKKKQCVDSFNIDCLLAWELLVCYTAVFSVVTQCSFPQTAAENRTTFLSLCVCGLTNKPIMALGSEHASQFSTNQSIVAEFRRALCSQATKRLICKKSLF